MAKPTKKTRIKADALTVTYSTREEVEKAITELGYLQRELEAKAIEQNDALAEITAQFAPLLQGIQDEIKPIQQAIQAWCEANRDDLTENGKRKTAKFNTGETQWRQRPPSVAIRGKDTVLENLKKFGLERFIRIKEEPNKDAMLNEPEVAGGIAGITIKMGVEDFVITPFEQDVK